MFFIFKRSTLFLCTYRICRSLSKVVRKTPLKNQNVYKPGCIGRVYLQVIGSGASGAPKSVYVFTEKKRYLFNCGEGTQRLAHEHKIKVSHLDDIFITTKTWDSLGGLPGMSLTLQSAGVSKVNLHGPPGLDILYKATNRFIAIEDMSVVSLNCSPEKEYNDDIMSVKYVPMRPVEKIGAIGNEKSSYVNKSNNGDIGDVYCNPNQDKITQGTKDCTSTITDDFQDTINGSDCSMGYICKFQKQLGVLDLEKCLEKGITTRELLTKVRNMQDVVLADGTSVRVQDVYTPDIPGPIFIVIDIPELSYLNESEFLSHFDTPVTLRESIPAIVVHFTPSNVLKEDRYQTFMQKFGPHTKHLLVNDSNTCQGLLGVHRMQQKLHLLNNKIFPLLRDSAVPVDCVCDLEGDDVGLEAEVIEELSNKVAHAQIENVPEYKLGRTSEDNVIQAQSLTIYNLLSRQYLDRSQEIKLKVHDYIQEIMKVDGFSAAMQEFYKKVEESKLPEHNSSNEYPKVVFLGTGSSVPGKTRNTSGIMLHVDENSAILMDCGEGTYGQLVRFYGLRHTNSTLRNMKAIYISHLHADHHIGLISLLQARRKALDELKLNNSEDPLSNVDMSNEQLYLLAPGAIMRWLLMYEQTFENITREFQLISNSEMVQKRGEGYSSGLPPAILSYLGLSAVQMCYVQHCPSAFGVAFTTKRNEKITYSGDTIPCDDLVNIGKDSTLLIHEATMEDNLARDARMKMHSTTSQAVNVGQRMRARHTILTHFSQRYARLPVLSQDMLDGDGRSVGIAFDNMQVTLNDLKLLPHMYASLRLMFEEECNLMEARAAKREKRQSWTRKLEGSR